MQKVLGTFKDKSYKRTESKGDLITLTGYHTYGIFKCSFTQQSLKIKIDSIDSVYYVETKHMLTR